jgi:hypothetical protein
MVGRDQQRGDISLFLGWVKSFFGRRRTAEQKMIDIAISRLDRCRNVANAKPKRDNRVRQPRGEGSAEQRGSGLRGFKVLCCR